MFDLTNENDKFSIAFAYENVKISIFGVLEQIKSVVAVKGRFEKKLNQQFWLLSLSSDCQKLTAGTKKIVVWIRNSSAIMRFLTQTNIVEIKPVFRQKISFDFGDEI